MNRPIVVPIALNYTRNAIATLPWLVQGTEYHPCDLGYAPLVNGEKAFASVHRAILGAKKTVDIICWGFQPSMYFIRDGKSPSIGELLIQKAKEGVQVRVLGWAMAPAGINVSGWGGESNLPGYGTVGVFDRTGQTASDERYAYDKKWFSKYGDGTEPWKVAQENWAQPLSPRLGLPLRFIGRGFDASERAEIYHRTQLNLDRQEISKTTQGTYAVSVTHHQKMVLVDYELPECATGFVMGHNMLDEYWDTDAHSVKRYKSHLGANGKQPRQDISSRITGSILEHLHHNFAVAWRKETGEDLLGLRKSKEAGKKLYARADAGEGAATRMIAQILRTQSQGRNPQGTRPQDKEPVCDIEKLYLNAVNNANRFIYIENQYFRWGKLAEKIKAVAANMERKRKEHGAKEGAYPTICLFVVTNSSDEGVGEGTVNTYKMLNSLGRANVIPGVAKGVRLHETEAALEEAKAAQYLTQFRSNKANGTAISTIPTRQQAQLKEKAEATQALAEAKQKTAALEEKAKALKDPEYIVRPESINGLKVVICTLVAPDSSMERAPRPPLPPPGIAPTPILPPSSVPRPLPPRTPWTPVYVHSKLMIVDDVFTTHGSANINTRSMEVDSELNIAHVWPDVTQKLRRDLWRLHTNGKGAQDKAVEAFKAWGDIIKENQRAEQKHLPPTASLVEFYRDNPKLSDKD